jgi:anaerobic magnesium-protoporphyrin IX monomethyl ester cyclase
MAPGTDSVASDEGWVTVHGPKLEAARRRKGEETAAMACGGGKEQLVEGETAAPAPAG